MDPISKVPGFVSLDTEVYRNIDTDTCSSYDPRGLKAFNLLFIYITFFKKLTFLQRNRISFVLESPFYRNYESVWVATILRSHVKDIAKYGCDSRPSFGNITKRGCVFTK